MLRNLVVDSSKFFFYTRKKPEDLQEFFSDLSSHSDYEILELDVIVVVFVTCMEFVFFPIIYIPLFSLLYVFARLSFTSPAPFNM